MTRLRILLLAQMQLENMIKSTQERPMTDNAKTYLEGLKQELEELNCLIGEGE